MRDNLLNRRAQFLPQLGMFFAAHFLAGVFGQRRIQRVRIPRLEEYQEPGRIAFHLLHRIIHAVFARHALKGFDILAAQFDVAHALILPDQLFDRLPAHIAHTRLRIVLLLLLVRHILGDCRAKQTCGHLRRVDRQGQAFLFYLLLQGSSPPY